MHEPLEDNAETNPTFKDKLFIFVSSTILAHLQIRSRLLELKWQFLIGILNK